MKRNVNLLQFILVLVIYFGIYINLLPLCIRNITLLIDPSASSANPLIAYLFDCLILIALIFVLYREYRYGFMEIIKDWKKTILIMIFGVFVLFITNFITGILATLLSGSLNSVNQSMIEESTQIAPIYMFFSVAIFAPIVEEGVFRGTIQNVLAYKLPKWLAIIFSALVFGMLHLIAGLTLGNLKELFFILPYMGLGIILGIFYDKYSISRTILIHSLYNLISFLMIFNR